MAKKRAQDALLEKPRRGNGGAGAKEADKKKEGQNNVEARFCVVCPRKPARDHLKPGQHREGTEYWCEECWDKFERTEKGGWQSSAAASHQTALVKVVRTPEE